ncbi:hypothetical protein FMZ60_09005 [Alcaligenaceae bacterium SJ-26]|nr:hypothetical protein FMZ60_09005 [Alcaligenaceae bacterium SJ-26]
MDTRTRQKGGQLARLAGTFCSQPRFRAFSGTASSEDAAEWIRQRCGIQSRAELDSNKAAAERFHRRVRIPYVNWQIANYQ